MPRLILLNTPIGDLADMSGRVLAALREGTHFAVEDTRSFRELLARVGVSGEGKRVLSLHDHSSEAKWERLLDLIREGHDLHVCSEAGSPVLSDPAYPLVRLAQEHGIEVETFSGVTAVVAALELSGLPPLPFSFHGFLPRDEGKIRAALGQLGQGTHIFFEAPGRLRATLALAAQAWPAAEIAVVKEIGKSYQRVWRFRAGEGEKALAEMVEKGEFVWLVHLPADPRPTVPGAVKEAAEAILSGGVGNKAVARLVGEVLERPAKEIYAEINRGAKS